MKIRVFERRPRISIGSATRLDEYQYVSNQLQIEYIDVEQQTGARAISTASSSGHGRDRLRRPIERITVDSEQELTNGLIKVVQGKQNKVYFVQGHGEKRTEDTDRRGYCDDRRPRSSSDNFAYRRRSSSRSSGRCPTTPRSSIVAGPDAPTFSAEIETAEGYLAKGGKSAVLLDPPREAGRPGAHEPHRAAEGVGRSRPARNVVVDCQRQWVRCSARGLRSAAGCRQYEPHPITTGFRTADGLFDWRARLRPIAGGGEQPLRAEPHRDEPEQLGGNDIKRADDVGPGSA